MKPSIDNLNKLMQDHNQSASDMADLGCVTTQQVNNWRSGARDISKAAAGTWALILYRLNEKQALRDYVKTLRADK